ncbi:hypothetical protein, partial [Aeromonas salmonicida]|uniref:hypothetical protein n=1 Tax=Aeromonas salmonicida TaxID=645 RepID=UPI0035A3B9DD
FKLLKSVTLVALRRRILRSSLRKSSDCFRFSFGAASQGSCLIRLACSAVLVGAHYREPRQDDKGFLQKCVRLLKKQAEAPETKTSAPI